MVSVRILRHQTFRARADLLRDDDVPGQASRTADAEVELPVGRFDGDVERGADPGNFVLEVAHDRRRGRAIDDEARRILGSGSRRRLLQAALDRDYTVVMGVVILYATLIMVLNLVSDVLYAVLDPRVKLT